MFVYFVLFCCYCMQNGLSALTGFLKKGEISQLTTYLCALEIQKVGLY